MKLPLQTPRQLPLVREHCCWRPSWRRSYLHIAHPMPIRCEFYAKNSLGRFLPQCKVHQATAGAWSLGLGPRAWSQKTGSETISLQMNDHTDRGLGGRQYGTSEEIETFQGQNNPSAARLRTVEECSSSFARSGQFARIIRSCHRRVHRVALF